jgi:hypothetical protein
MHQPVRHPDGAHKMQPIARHSRIYTFCAIALFFALSCAWCIQFFPFTDLRSHVMTDGDPALNAWALNWVSHAIVNDSSNILNGNTFYPHPGAIKLSEHMFSLALINVVIRFFSDGPWVGYNILIFLAYFLSAVGAYYFIYHVTQNRLAAFWGGVFWGFCFFRVHHTSHLQILSYQWLAFIALFNLKTQADPNAKNATLLALFFILQALTSWYLAVIAAVFTLVMFLCNLQVRTWRSTQTLAFGWTAILVTAVMLPFVLAYSGVLHDTSLGDRATHARALGDQIKLLNFFAPPSSTLLGSLIPNNKYWIWQENTLFIGYSAIFLALIGLATIWRHNWRLGVTAIFLMLTGYMFALGFFSTFWGIKLPLYYLSEKISFFSAIRAPQRFTLLIYFGILILSSYGLIAISTKLGNKSKALATGVLVCVFILEVYPAKLPFGPIPTYTPSAIDQEIAKLSTQNNTKYKILHLPIYTARPGYPTQEATYMVDSTLHWNPILNGFSGAEPIEFKADMLALAQLPSTAALALLEKYNVTIVAVHKTASAEQREALKTFVNNFPTWEITYTALDEFLIRQNQ